ncbi:MAG TPA: hypothetical protein VN457_06465 [Chlamydiales bacterium]|nr:hypothetical protein [Chlamydiales bacterium]
MAFFKRIISWIQAAQIKTDARVQRLPRWIRWLVAFLRQLPVTFAVAKLPIPYNFSVPVLTAAGKTTMLAANGADKRSFAKCYFKIFSRTLCGFSLKRFMEQTAKYTLSAQLDISEETLQAVGIILIIICVIIDAIE